ncbi:hypothetical protein [Methyloglobulus sp.]|uniref:hypothetical protein n=1 Tax=Methyloglobulus sp. TaxID=2518622 RepID=UPI00398A2569
MKLVLQIAMGVFLGALMSQLLLDQWHSYRAQHVAEAERQRLAVQEKTRNERDQRVREVLMGQLQGKAVDNISHPLKGDTRPKIGLEDQTMGIPPTE